VNTDFEGRLLRRLSTRVVPFAWGNAYLDDDLPVRLSDHDPVDAVVTL